MIDNESTESAKESTRPPSRWWILYHFWAGICAKTYSDASGLTAHLFGNPSGLDSSAASQHATVVTMFTLALVGGGYYCSANLIQRLGKSEFPQAVQRAIRWLLPFVYFVSMILLAGLTRTIISQGTVEGEQTQSDKVLEAPILPAQVHAFTTTQDSEGLDSSSLNQQFLNNLESWTIETVLEKGRNSFASQGFDPKDFKPSYTSSAVFVETQNEKLAIIEMRMESSVRYVSIVGFRSGNLYRVSCLRQSDHDIPIWSGPCGAEIKRTFGVSIAPDT